MLKSGLNYLFIIFTQIIIVIISYEFIYKYARVRIPAILWVIIWIESIIVGLIMYNEHKSKQKEKNIKVISM